MNYNKRTYGSQAANSRRVVNQPRPRGASRNNAPSGLSLKSIVCAVLLGIWRIFSDLLPFLRFPLLIIAVAWVIFYVVDGALSIPEVHVSNTTGECVRVILADGTEGDCDDLPPKYRHLWVE